MPYPLRTNFPSPTTAPSVALVKARGFHDQNILVINLDDARLSWEQKLLLTQIGEKLYGERVKSTAA